MGYQSITTDQAYEIYNAGYSVIADGDDHSLYFVKNESD